MKRIVYAVLATMTGLVLLFSYRTSLDATAPVAAAKSPSTTGSSGTASSAGSGSSGTGAAASGTSSSGSSTDGSTSAGGSSSSASGTGLADGTFTGQAVDTRYGPVQVQITVSGGRIADVSVPEYPDSERRDQEINAQAIPQLVAETKAAQSAQIDMVSGATFTSNGYAQSLQSALDQAKA